MQREQMCKHRQQQSCIWLNIFACSNACKLSTKKAVASQRITRIQLEPRTAILRLGRCQRGFGAWISEVCGSAAAALAAELAQAVAAVRQRDLLRGAIYRAAATCAHREALRSSAAARIRILHPPTSMKLGLTNLVGSARSSAELRRDWQG